jgi:large subunit ribosomal protein L5e
MVFVKVQKTKAYFKRFQTKFKRRRQGKTDYYARRRLIWQDKNKYGTPKYRLVVRFTNKDITCQIFYARIQGDICVAEAHSKELMRYGVTVGLTNYSASYATGLLLARRTLSKFNLDKLYVGVEQADGEEFCVEQAPGQKRASFRCNLDTGLARTSTGANLFGVLKGAVDGGLDIPHSNKRFPGYDPESKEYNAEEHKKRIFGHHVAAYITDLKEKKEDDKLAKQFSRYVKNNLTSVKAVEKMYQTAHSKIRADPKPKAKAVKKNENKHKTYKKTKLNLKQRRDKVKQKKATFLKKLEAELGSA